MKKLIAFLLVLAMTLPCMFVYAEDAKLEHFDVECDYAMTVDKYCLENLSDGNVETSAMFSPVKNAKIVFTPKVAVDISKIRIAVENFPGWRNIRELTVTYDGSVKDVIAVPDFVDDIRWVESNVSKHGVKSITVEVTGVHDNNSTECGALAEVEFYGRALEEYVDENGEIQGGTPENRKLIYEEDFSYVTTSGKISAVANWFDGNYGTHAYMSPLDDNYFVIQFTYPTDVTSISFASVDNFEHKYRSRLKYPSPAYSGVSYQAQKKATVQKFDVSQDDSMKQITHLIFKVSDVYTFSTGAEWGGIFELELEGMPNTALPTVAEGLATELVSNAEIVKQWGLLGDGDIDAYSKV